MKFLENGGGYYIDVGASQLIIDGHIKITQGQEVAQITARGLLLTNGTELLADDHSRVDLRPPYFSPERAIRAPALALKVTAGSQHET